MPTWEQHQRALGRARAAGDTEAVAEIESAIAGEVEASKQPEYSRERFTRAMDKAGAAGDMEAVGEIANDWMDAAQAAGRKTPRDFGDDEVLSGLREARDKKDKHFETLFSVEAQRRGLREKGMIEGAIDAVGGGVKAVGDAVMGIPGAVVSGAENFGRGAARLASGEADLDDLGGAIVDNVQTMATSIPGADLVEAGSRNIANMATGRGFDMEMDEKVRARNQASADRNPLAALAGEVAGAGAVANRVMQAPGLAVTAGKPLTNVAKTAAAGGAAEGAVTLVDTLDPAKAAGNAAVGAVVAPLVGAAAKKAIEVAAPSGRMVQGKSLPSGMTKLAQLLKIPVADLEKARVSLKASRGSNPSIAEIVDTATIQRTQPVIASQPVVAKAAQEAAEAAEVVRPQQLKKIVEDGKKTGSAKQATIERKKFFDDVMKTHGNRPVQFNDPSFMNKDAVVRSLTQLSRNAAPQVRGILEKFSDAIDQGKPGALRVRDIENIRVALSDAIKANPSLKEALAPVRERLNTIAGNQIPEYGDALKLYGQMGEVIKGVKEGADAVKGSLADVRSNVGNADPRRRGGQQVGMRTRLAEDVGNSYGRSTRAAQDLVDPATGERVAAVMGRAEADRIAAAGRQEAQAGRNLDELNPAPNPAATRPGNDATLALDTAAALGPAGAGYRANVIVSILNKFKSLGMSEKAAKGLSEALFDPAKAEDAIAVLQRIGKWEETKVLLAQKAAATQVGTEGNE